MGHPRPVTGLIYLLPLSGIFTAMLPTITQVIRSAFCVITRLMKKRVCLDLSKQRTACILRVREFGHVNAEMIIRRKYFDYLEWLPLV